MRENRLYGSEGGEVKSLPYPYQGVSNCGLVWIASLSLAMTGTCLLYLLTSPKFGAAIRHGRPQNKSADAHDAVGSDYCATPQISR